MPIFQILAVAGFFQAASNATYWVFLSKGLTRANLYFSLATRPMLIGLIVLGSLWGVLGVATAYSISAAILWPIGLLWIARTSDAPAGAMFRNGLRTISVYVFAGGASYLATMGMPTDAYLMRLLVGAAALVGAVALLILVVPPFRRDVRAMLTVRKHFRSGPSKTPGEA